LKLKSKQARVAVDRLDGRELSPFLPLPQLQFMRKVGRTDARTKRVERHMGDFKCSAGQQNVTFRYGVDFVEGNDRLRWTPAGIDKLLAAGLWRREFDRRGNLKSKPVTPEAAMKLPGARPCT
jgi:hypothetical protein